jgi:arylsulfatase A-like enzyme
VNRRQFLPAAAAAPAVLRARADRPNIIWILGDDLGCELGCYGNQLVRTPNIDRLAAGGVRFTQAHTTAPVCSASRSAWNTGLYQTTIGAHHHRSHRKDGYALPPGVRLVTDHLRDLGYFTCNVLEFAPGMRGSGKTDFNFTAGKPFDGAHWNQRKPGQPFYAQINFREPHKGPAFKEAREQRERIDPAKVELPPYFPDHPVVRDEMANYLDAVNLLDRKVGALLEALERDRALDNTAIVFFSDNGRCLIRGKQWLYDYGTHIPLIARWPGVLPAGKVREDPVVALDINATTLDWAGVPLPSFFHGRKLFEGPRRDFIVTARDRCDETVDRIRAVRDGRYKYIRNFMPDRPYTQSNDYIERQYPTLGVMKQHHREGRLNAVQQLFMAPRKPAVEFYDTLSDRFEVRNLAGEPPHQKRIEMFARRLDDWMASTKDLGGEPEPESARAL